MEKKTLLPCQRFSNCHRALKRHIREKEKDSKKKLTREWRAVEEEKGNGAAGGRRPSWLHFTQLSGNCHYLLYSSSPFITKYFSSFICCFSRCCCCCLLCWHPTEFASERGTSRRTFQRRQPAYLQLFDCLTQRLTAEKKRRSQVGGSRHMENFACSSLSSGKQQQEEQS